jgi:pimeloyl-ACP methyl ester carboxylesterase
VTNDVSSVAPTRASHRLRDGASLSYLTAGSPSGPAVLLIHGSTETAASDWFEHSDVGTRLADLGYFVVAPDCRAHGHSSATRTNDGAVEYSFEQMAADGAELLRALGVPRAFVCGHSNGGTVALCLTKSFPLQVRAAVVLAGNAYVDDHVRTRVPIGMDADRVEMESPGWRDSMVALHDSFHGPGYWRELLGATVTETIAHPNWTADHLASLDVPVLAVQGTDDSVNTPGEHAQTIAAWLPRGSLWLAEARGHSVHWESPVEFVERITTFFASAPS